MCVVEGEGSRLQGSSNKSLRNSAGLFFRGIQVRIADQQGLLCGTCKNRISRSFIMRYVVIMYLGGLIHTGFTISVIEISIS